MTRPPRPVPRLDVEAEEDFQAFLRAHPRALVLFRGESCSYSRAFEPAFEAGAPLVPGWMPLVRHVEHAGEGPHGRRHGIEVTPTVVAYAEGRALARLEATVMVGIPARRYEAWLRGLPG